jgi:hypothetical protein
MLSGDRFIGPERLAGCHLFRHVVGAPVSTLVIVPLPPVDMSTPPIATCGS